MKILFWNTGKKEVDDALISMALNENVDLLILAEYETESKFLLRKLDNAGMNYYNVPQIGCKRINILTKYDLSSIDHGPEDSYYTTKIFKIPGVGKILMGCVHFPSKLYMDEDDHLAESGYFKQNFERIENDIGIKKSIIIGDFNMNPFEKGMVSADGFHSIPCSKVIQLKNGKRKIRDREHTMFYNPMWNLLGDIDNKPGTYYYSSSSYKEFFWNILDQVIIRPELIDYFDKYSLKILTNTGGISLIDNNGKPKVSDHLPITFRFNFYGESNG